MELSMRLQAKNESREEDTPKPGCRLLNGKLPFCVLVEISFNFGGSQVEFPSIAKKVVKFPHFCFSHFYNQ